MAYLTTSTQPADDVISLGEMKDFLRVDHDDEDSLILSLVMAATEYAQSYTNRQFVNATLKQYLDGFPHDDDRIVLPRVPVVSVTSIQYTDEDGDTQTVSSSNYVVSIPDNAWGQITLVDDASWPDDEADQADAVVITFVAGHGSNNTTVPDTAKTAIKMLAADMYEHREANTETKLNQNSAVMWLLDSLRVPEVF